MPSEPGLPVARKSAQGFGLGNASGTPPESWETIRQVAGRPETTAWISLLTDREFLPADADSNAAFAVLDWWMRVLELDSDNPFGALHRIPESFGSARLSADVRGLQFHLEKLKPYFEFLQRGESTLGETVAQVAFYFHQEERLDAWKREVDRMTEALCWASAFEVRRRYVTLAFPSGQGEIDGLRKELLDRIDSPYSLMAESERAEFDALFKKFKRSYIDLYHLRHEDMALIGTPSSGGELRVDTDALQNLELLSCVNYADKRHLNRVRLLGKLLKGNRCGLPVRDILEEYPRCYCNFDPTGATQTLALISEMNRTAREGIEHIRGLLRKRSRIIINGLQALQADDHHSRQIASLLSRGNMLPLKKRTIDILNQVIQRHPAEFISIFQVGLKKPQRRRS